MNDAYAVGVDLGATKIATALVRQDGAVMASRLTATEAAKGEQSVLQRIANEVNVLVHNAPAPVVGVGIGTPGVAIPTEGVVYHAVNLGWERVDLVKGVQAYLDPHLPIWIQKDTNASALGEYYFGAARGCDNFVYLSIGSGLGGGVVLGGRIVVGSNWQAAELGHISLDSQGWLCACGRRGCAETVVSGPGLIKITRQMLEQGQLASCLAVGELNTAAILSAARAGDALAQAAFDRVGENLGQVAAFCISVLNPAMIVLGGGLGLAAFDLLLPAFRRELERRLTPSTYQHVQIVASLLTSSAVGASCLAWYGQE